MVELNKTMNRREFASQFQAIHRRLWLIAAACVGDRTQADDIVQEAAIVAFRKRHDFKVDTNFHAWVARIVRHCASNYNRKVAGRRTYATDPGSLDQVPERQANNQSNDDRRSFDSDVLGLDDEMRHALEGLSEVARCCLLLRVVDGASYADISDCVGIPEGTAMSHVHRSKKVMRERLDAMKNQSDDRDGGAR